MKTIRFSFDWGSTECLWDDEGPMQLACLGISQHLYATLTAMGEQMQSALNWADPQAPSPWSPECGADFVHRTKIAYAQLCEELGDQYEIVYAFSWFEN
jgi:hypothetical protein